MCWYDISPLVVSCCPRDIESPLLRCYSYVIVCLVTVNISNWLRGSFDDVVLYIKLSLVYSSFLDATTIRKLLYQFIVFWGHVKILFIGKLEYCRTVSLAIITVTVRKAGGHHTKSSVPYASLSKGQWWHRLECRLSPEFQGLNKLVQCWVTTGLFWTTMCVCLCAHTHTCIYVACMWLIVCSLRVIMRKWWLFDIFFTFFPPLLQSMTLMVHLWSHCLLDCFTPSPHLPWELSEVNYRVLT